MATTASSALVGKPGAKPKTPSAAQIQAQLQALNPTQQQQFLRYITAVNGGTAPPSIPLSEAVAYGNQRNQANLTYRQGLARQAYDRANADASYGASRTQVLDQYQQAREQIPAAYAARGLEHSGLATRGYLLYAKHRTQALGNLRTSHTAQLGGLSLQKQALDQTRANALASIASTEAARRQELASQIRSVK